jgi:hypothetical protein
MKASIHLILYAHLTFYSKVKSLIKTLNPNIRVPKRLVNVKTYEGSIALLQLPQPQPRRLYYTDDHAWKRLQK